MKKILIIAAVVSSGMGLVSCGGGKGNHPGYAYMPDMYYSRAYEAYGYNNMPEDHDLKGRGIYYTGLPVPGTIARGDAMSVGVLPGDSGYALAASLQSPLQGQTLTDAQMKEAERLYLIHCGICHGAKLDGNGPLWNNGNGPFPAAPKNLLDPEVIKIPDGQYYQVITYGKGQMGSYASQLKPEERWWVIAYLRNTTKPKTDTAGKATAPAAAATQPNPQTNP